MIPEPTPASTLEGPASEPAPPACVMCFNASDPSGAGGLAGDIATIAAMGAHALPIVTSVVMRDTADIFDQHEIDAEAVAEQARTILEDVTIAGWKVGFLGNADNVSAVAEILSDYTEIPLVSYLHNLSWLEEDQLQPYLDAFRELILPATEVLVGSHKTLQDFLLPDWDSDPDAIEAERSGLVSRVVPLDKLMEEALGAALMISEFSQVATIAAKESVNRAFETGLSDGVMFERRLFHALFATADQKEGMDAFVNKRKAVFTHR